jgi:hypothetical protein
MALYAMQTVNLLILATAFSGPAKEKSNYKRLQCFMGEFEPATPGPLNTPKPYLLIC